MSTFLVGGCDKKDESTPQTTTTNPAPVSSPVTQPAGVQVIGNLTAFPRCDDGGTLHAAVHCDANAASGPRNVVWTLKSRRSPNAALWIIALDPAASAWHLTGQIAVVEPSGTNAVGVIDGAGDYGLTDVPARTWERPHTQLEWTNIIANYDDMIEKLSDQLTEKYRTALEIAPGLKAKVVDWTADDASFDLVSTAPGDVAATTIIVQNTRCLVAARKEFRTKRALIESSYKKGLNAWISTIKANNSPAACALWQAANDLRSYRRWAVSMRPGKPMFSYVNMLGGSVTLEGVAALSAWANDSAKDPRFRNSIADLASRLGDEEIRDKFLGKIDDWIGGAFTGLFEPGAPASNIDRLITALTCFGDATIDVAAYPEQPTVPTDTDYRGLKANLSDGYLTGYALKWNPDPVIDSRFGIHPATVKFPGQKDHLGRCKISLKEMRMLAATNGGMDVTDDSDVASIKRRVTFRWVTEYSELKKQLDAIEKDIQKRGDEGEAAWLAQVGGANKARSAAAIRMLMYDLRALVRNEAIASESRDRAIGRLTDSMLRSTPGGAERRLRPFAAITRYFVDEYADYFSPSHLGDLLDILDGQAIDAAIRSVAPPEVGIRSFGAPLADELQIDPANMPSECSK